MTLRELYVADLGHLRDITQRLLLEWPLLAARTDAPGLRDELDRRYRDTQAQLLQLDSLLADLDERARPGTAAGLACLLDSWHTRHEQLATPELRALCVVTTVVGIDALAVAAYTGAAAAATAVGHHEGVRVLRAELQRRRDEMQVTMGRADELGGSVRGVTKLPPVSNDVAAAWSTGEPAGATTVPLDGPPAGFLSSAP